MGPLCTPWVPWGLRPDPPKTGGRTLSKLCGLVAFGLQFCKMGSMVASPWKAWREDERGDRSGARALGPLIRTLLIVRYLFQFPYFATFTPPIKAGFSSF